MVPATDRPTDWARSVGDAGRRGSGVFRRPNRRQVHRGTQRSKHVQGMEVEMANPPKTEPQVGEEQRVNRTSTTARRIRRLVLSGATLAIALLGGVGITSAAQVQVDPTSLTPPLQPYRVCYLDGQSIRCDTSGTTTVTN